MWLSAVRNIWMNPPVHTGQFSYRFAVVQTPTKILDQYIRLQYRVSVHRLVRTVVEWITDNCKSLLSYETVYVSLSARRTRTVVTSREVEAGPAFDVYKGVDSTGSNASHLGVAGHLWGG